MTSQTLRQSIRFYRAYFAFNRMLARRAKQNLAHKPFTTAEKALINNVFR